MLVEKKILHDRSSDNLIQDVGVCFRSRRVLVFFKINLLGQRPMSKMLQTSAWTNKLMFMDSLEKVSNY